MIRRLIEFSPVLDMVTLPLTKFHSIIPSSVEFKSLFCFAKYKPFIPLTVLMEYNQNWFYFMNSDNPHMHFSLSINCTLKIILFPLKTRILIAELAGDLNACSVGWTCSLSILSLDVKPFQVIDGLMLNTYTSDSNYILCKSYQV